MNLADALITTLRDWDVGYLFGVGGANIEHLYDAVHRLGRGRLETVCAKSEVGAAFMADGRARSHRTLGVCLATSGGGMMNLAVGVAESYADAIPVLAIVGQPPTRLHGRGAFQDSSGIGRTVDADRLWSAITKYRMTITDPARFWSCLETAVRTALSGRQGPAALLIPRDLFECEVGPRPVGFPQCLNDFRHAHRASDMEIESLFAAIRAARSPALLVGAGVDRCRDPEAVSEFARRMGMLVATTMASKHAFPHDDPLHLGMAGVAGEPSVHRFLRDEADLIVAVGTDLNMMTAQPLLGALTAERLAIVNVDPREALRVATPALCVEGDEGEVFERLNQRCVAAGIRPRKCRTIVRRRFTPRLAAALPQDDFVLRGERARDELLQSEALAALQDYLPEEGHVLFDAGNCAAAALHYLNLPRGVSSGIALGMGGMGYSLAAAIGAQLGAADGTRTVVICGDGAFLMLGTEVNTAVQHELPILFVVFNNNMHGMCVTRQQLYFDGRIEGSRYPNVSIADMARGLGAGDRLWVGSAGTREELQALLEEHRHFAARPGVLELRLAREEIPPFTPFLSPDAPTYFTEPVVDVSLSDPMSIAFGSSL